MYGHKPTEFWTPFAPGTFGRHQFGTTIKFKPPLGHDMIVTNGLAHNVNTTHQCITAMKEYENKSLDELRVEDYLAGRMGKPETTGFWFGNASATTQSLFGPMKTANTCLFGTQAASASNSFSFGASAQCQSGTTIRFNPPLGFDTRVKNGVTQNIKTKHQCVTAMEEYEYKSLEELRVEDYLVDRKGKQSTLGFRFGSAASTVNTKLNCFACGQVKPTGFGSSTGFISNTSIFSGLLGQTKSQASFGGRLCQNKSQYGATLLTAQRGFDSGITSSDTGLFENKQTDKKRLCASKPVFGTTTTLADEFSFSSNPSASANMSLQPFSQGSAGFGFYAATTPQALSSGTKPVDFSLTTTTTDPTQSKSCGYGAFGSTSLTGLDCFCSTRCLATEPKLQGTYNLQYVIHAAQLQQTFLQSTHTSNGESPPLLDMKNSAAGRKDLLKINNPVAQKTVLSSQQESQFFEDLGEDDFKKLTLLTGDQDSTTTLSPSYVSGRRANLSTHSDEDHSTDRSDVDDPSTVLNSLARDPVTSEPAQDAMVNISNISHNVSVNNDAVVEGRQNTPNPHQTGIVLTRPAYYTIPSMEALANMVDPDGNCFVEDFIIGREGFGSIFFPGVTNVANMNFDEIVFFRRKEIIVYPGDGNKPPVGEGLNKKAEITLDCVWPRDKSLNTPIKSPEKLQVIKWLDKVEEYTLKIGAKFIDYRPETGSWVFEVKHFSKYVFLDDSEDEDIIKQRKKHLHTLQR